MKYTLIGSLRSPFVRMSRLLMINNKIDFTFQVIDYLEVKKDQEFLAQISPVNKVPVFLDGDQKIFDSRVIYNHLVQKHGLKPLSIEEENYLTAVHSLLDVCVNLFLLKRSGFNLDKDNWYVARQNARIPEALNYLKSWMTKLNPSVVRDWNYASMSLYSFLFWAENRIQFDLSPYPEARQFLEKFKDAPGVHATDYTRN